MKTTYVVKEFKFEAAHYLPNYEGACANMHGHSYKLQVAVSGSIEKNGMVLDFAELKKIVNMLIIQHLDHVCLNEVPKFFGFPVDMPTAENMVVWMAERLTIPLQREGAKLAFVKLWETDTSFAMQIADEAEEANGDSCTESLPKEKDYGNELLNVHSIFESISGEAGFFQQGSWCAFIRLQGCNLRCPWCDTKDSQTVAKTNNAKSIPSILDKVKQKQVLITGGEPLLQPETLSLIKALLAAGKDVQVETNGTFPIPTEPEFDECKWVVDYKLPSSKSIQQFVAFPFRNVPNNAIIKFVISSQADWLSTIASMDKFNFVGNRGTPIFIISIILNDEVTYQQIRETIQKDDPLLLAHIIFSMQVHKAMGLA